MRLDELKKIQREFVSAIVLREPQIETRFDDNGLDVYRRMNSSFNISVLESIFPATRAILGEDGWANLVEQFHEERGFDHFNVNSGVRPFVQLINDVGLSVDVAELAEYEYLQLVIAESPVLGPDQFKKLKTSADLLPGKVIFNKTARFRQYQHNVAKMANSLIAGEFASIDSFKKPVRLILFRHPEALDVRCLEVNEKSWELATYLSEERRFTHTFKRVSQVIGLDLEDFLNAAVNEVFRFQEIGLIYGTRT